MLWPVTTASHHSCSPGNLETGPETLPSLHPSLPSLPPPAGELHIQATYMRERDGVIAPALVLQLLLNEGRTMPAVCVPAEISVGETYANPVGEGKGEVW